jgi:methionyl-tRNA synthetase
MPENKPKFYLTTPIYYVNARPHIGHAYSTIAADVIARRHRLLGDDTFFLTGTDEHGQKIQRASLAAGVPPQQYADQVSATFRDLWKRMGITNDDYIRTTDDRHKRGVQKLWKTLEDHGAIYLSSYTGQYSVGEEMFVEGPPGTIGPDGKPTETITEENYFFRLSDYQLPLIDLIESNQLHIQPETTRNEVLSFLRGNITTQTSNQSPRAPESHSGKAGNESPFLATAPELSANGTPYVPGALKDLSISRTSFTWGIPVPGSQNGKAEHVIYVWLDALANYMTAIGYGSDAPEDLAKFERYWPADLHLVGKEITRFHCIYWPAFLLAAGLPLPKAVVANGWLLFEDSKMSKSRGNVVRTETILDAFGSLKPKPEDLPGPVLSEEYWKHEQDLFAADVLRYFLLREIPFGQDGSFSFDALVQRYNSDLANGYGNLVSRTLKLIDSNFSGAIPAAPKNVLILGDLGEGQREKSRDGTSEVIRLINVSREAYGKFADAYDFAATLAVPLSNIAAIDRYISDQAPWKLAKKTDQDSRFKLAEVLYTAAEAIRIITAQLFAFMPYATAAVWQQLGLGDIERAAQDGELRNLQWGGLKPGTPLGPLAPIFPRAPKELIQLMTDAEAANTPPKTEAPTPSKFVDEKTTHTAPIAPDPTSPAAPPRTISRPSTNSAPTVAGSHALTTERPGTPPHGEAHASGVFATAHSPQLTAHSSTPSASPALSEATPQIAIDDFVKIDLRVARIVVAERIPKADKLLRLEVDLGYERRQILSGIAEWYTPEDLLGRRIVIIANLAPRKMRGLESHGMLLAASHGDNGKPILATFSEDIALGSRLR